MPICHKDKVIFIHIPKTGGTSISKYLFGYYNEFKHHNFLYYKNLIGNDIINFNIASCVRNSFDRIRSYFSMHYGKYDYISRKIDSYKFTNFQDKFLIYLDLMLFKDFKTNNNRNFLVNKTQTSFLINENNVIEPSIKIIRYENIHNYKFLPRISNSVMKLKNKDIYNTESINIVKDYFIDDFKNFGYNHNIEL